MPIHYSDGISWLTSQVFDAYEIKHGFFMRHGGCSPHPWKSLNMATSVGDSRENVIENRRRIADSLMIESNSFYDLWQVHSDSVIIAERPRALSEAHLKADAIVTDKSSVALLMLFADCVPMLFFDPEHKVIGAAHAGWKGTIGGIASKTIKRMTDKFHSSPEKIISVIGPSICREHYPIGEDVAEKVNSAYKPDDQVLIKQNGKIFMDLPKANRILLEKCGLKYIEVTNICTQCNNEDWFSHRAENGKTGRFAAIITL